MCVCESVRGLHDDCPQSLILNVIRNLNVEKIPGGKMDTASFSTKPCVNSHEAPKAQGAKTKMFPLYPNFGDICLIFTCLMQNK